jgi:hypothetical protein
MWLPIIKALAPIALSAIPAFTKKQTERTDPDPIVSQQITELQETVKKNVESIATLAKALEEAVKANDQAIRRTQMIALAAAVLAGCSLLLAVVTWLR